MPTKTLTTLPSDYAVALTTAAGSASANLWAPNSIITYRFDANVSADDRVYFRMAMDHWQELTGLTFVQTTGTPNVSISFAALPAGTAGQAHRGPTAGGILQIDDGYAGAIQPGGQGFRSVVHELGHTIGLSHPGNYNGGTATPAQATYFEDAAPFSIMSYWSAYPFVGGSDVSSTIGRIPYYQESGSNLDPSTDDPEDHFYFPRTILRTAMPWDIATVAHYYQEQIGVRAGSDTYFFNSTLTGTVYALAGFDDFAGTIIDHGGYDTLDLSMATDKQIIDLRTATDSGIFKFDGGRFSSILGYGGNLFIPNGTQIEKVLGGSLEDYLYARDGVDTYFDGGDGQDELHGGTGNDSLHSVDDFSDSLYGGDGDDTYEVEDGDYVSDRFTSGNDTLYIRAGDPLRSTTARLGSGGDTVFYEGVGAAEIDLGSGNNILRSTGSGSLDVTATDGDDDLEGGSGDDTIDAGGGNDEVTGGAGNDHLEGGSGQDNLDGGEDNDTLLGGADLDGLHGGEGNDTLQGGAGLDFLWGDGGSDVLDGGDDGDTIDGGAGADKMTGGTGDDAFVVDDAGDIVIEVAGGGTDDYVAVLAVSYVLTAAAEIERLYIFPQWSEDPISLTGNKFAQTITANAGANILSDGGKGGADTLIGLEGNDTYLIYNSGDIVVETVSQGDADRVAAGVNYKLGADVHVENLTTTSSAGTAAISLTGNTFAQTITGNAGANTLGDGGKGAADTMKGLGGNDTYMVYNLGDIIVETSTQGAADRVAAAVSYTLAAGVHVESLTTTSSAGTTALNLTGNTLAQTIIGNAGANILHDGGAGAADTLRGLGGNDTYRVFNAGDTIVEVAGQGADLVIAAVDYVLSAGASVEQMRTNGSAGTAAIDLTGNDLGQEIMGNSGANILDGKAGDDLLEGLGGNDRLTGGTGKDSFVFSATLNASTNVDTITDFSAADDTIRLDDNDFAGLTVGALAAAAFRANTTGQAQDADDRIAYETDTGNLFYDADGTGAAARILFATLIGLPALGNADFIVF